MEDNEKPIDEFLDKLDGFMEELPEDDACLFAHRAIWNIAFNAGRNHLESMGILQCAVLDFQKQFDEYCDEEFRKKKKNGKTVKFTAS
jgi:hypothetical protein